MELTPISAGISNKGASNDIPVNRVERLRRFDSALDQFIVQNGVSTHEQSTSNTTFVDDDGTVRYIDSWQKVQDVTGVDQRQEISSTGCVTIPIELANEQVQAKRYILSFMLDYHILWKYFEKDSVDEIAEYAPLFHVYIEICFHPRTVQAMVFLTLYFLLVQFTADQVYCAIPPFQRIAYYIYISIQGVVYLSLLVLFKGSIFGKTSHFDERKGDTADTSAKVNNVRRNIRRNKMARWIYFAQEAVRTTSLELQSMFLSRSVTSANEGLNHTTPFYDALNIAAKFLTKHNMRDSNRVNLKSTRHNMKLFFIFFAVPVYCFLATYLSPNGSYSLYVGLCKASGQDSGLCQNLRWVFIFTLGYLLAALQMTIFVSSVLLTLTGLGFGSEIGRGLIDSWITRFGPLRRLNNTQLEEVDAVEKTEESVKRTNVSKIDSARFSATSNSVVNELHKQLEKHLQTLPDHGEASSITDVENTGVYLNPSEMLPYIPRDAYEHYLFVREFMCTGSRAWSPIIIALTFLCTYFVTLFVLGAVLIGAQLNALGWAYYGSWIFVRVYVLIIYPVVSLAHANAYVYALQEQFLVAAPEDFAALGGRDAWLDYLEKVPAVWTIYGLVITWDRLSGLLWTLLAALGAAVISFATSGGF